MTFVDSVFALIFGAKGIYAGNAELTLLAFATASALFGFCIVILDIISVKFLEKSSFLKLSYAGANAVIMFFVWGMGSGIGGLIGAGVGIFEVNRAACIFVGVGWPFILPRLLSSSKSELSKEKVKLGEQ